MKSLEELKAAQAKELAKAEREHALAAKLPFVPHRVMETGKSTGNYWITYKVKGLAEIVPIFRAFDIAPMYLASTGTMAVLPLELLNDKQLEVAEGVYALSFRVEQGAQYGANVKASFFASVEGSGIVKIICDVDGPDYIGAYNKLAASIDKIRDSRNRVVDSRTRANRILNLYFDRAVSWYASGKESANFSYYLCAECEDVLSGSAQVHALGQLANLIGELEGGNES